MKNLGPFSEEERTSFKERGILKLIEKENQHFKKSMIMILKSIFVRLGIPFHALISQMDLNFMNRLFKFHIACDMIAQEVHGLGQNEVKTIRSE